MAGQITRISDSAALAVFRRAAVLDAAMPLGVERDAVRQAALEAGISPTAVERALEEYDEEQRRHASIRRWTYRVAVTAAAGAAVFVVVVIGLALDAGMSVVDVIRDLFDLR